MLATKVHFLPSFTKNSYLVSYFLHDQNCRWLIDTIVVHYTQINKRVERDVEKEKQKIAKELEERRERIFRLRQERERQEALRRQSALSIRKNTYPSPPEIHHDDTDDDDDVVMEQRQVIADHHIPNVIHGGSCVGLFVI